MQNSDQQKPVEDSSFYNAILESISDGVFTVDADWRITSFNRAAEEITGILRQDAIGRLCADVFRSSMCENDCALRQTLQNGKAVIGRTGYIVNGDGNRIPISLSTAVLKDKDGNMTGGAETFRDLTEIESLRHELSARFKIGTLSSRSPLMQRLFEILPAVAASPGTVLITGETGTGKELVARNIHLLSKQQDGPFIALNCGALPDNLLESELFGYKAGAFTGANKDKPGRFALAQNGTLFLDEIGDISSAMQVKLLRVLQERYYEPLGGTTSVSTNARIIAATNRNLAEMVKEGSFREDLYYRINVVQIELPPLRSRKEDLPLLADQFIGKFNRLYQANVKAIAPEALSLLMSHHFPGNIRELENIIERAFILCQEELIGIKHLPKEILQLNGSPETATLHDSRAQLEAQTIMAALARCNYNRLAAAKELGIHKTTLFRKIKQLGLTLPKEQDGRTSRIQ